jgi:rubrerythrin
MTAGDGLETYDELADKEPCALCAGTVGVEETEQGVIVRGTRREAMSVQTGETVIVFICNPCREAGDLNRVTALILQPVKSRMLGAQPDLSCPMWFLQLKCGHAYYDQPRWTEGGAERCCNPKTGKLTRPPSAEDVEPSTREEAICMLCSRKASGLPIKLDPKLPANLAAQVKATLEPPIDSSKMPPEVQEKIAQGEKQGKRAPEAVTPGKPLHREHQEAIDAGTHTPLHMYACKPCDWMFSGPPGLTRCPRCMGLLTDPSGTSPLAHVKKQEPAPARGGPACSRCSGPATKQVTWQIQAMSMSGPICDRCLVILKNAKAVLKSIEPLPQQAPVPIACAWCSAQAGEKHLPDWPCTGSIAALTPAQQERFLNGDPDVLEKLSHEVRARAVQIREGMENVQAGLREALKCKKCGGPLIFSAQGEGVCAPCHAKAGTFADAMTEGVKKALDPYLPQCFACPDDERCTVERDLRVCVYIHVPGEPDRVHPLPGAEACRPHARLWAQGQRAPEGHPLFAKFIEVSGRHKDVFSCLLPAKKPPGCSAQFAFPHKTVSAIPGL